MSLLAISALPALLAVGSIVGALSLAKPKLGPVAAVFPPWWETGRTIRAAATAGRIVGFGAANFVVIVVPETAKIDSQLRAAGAWMLLDPKSVGGCFTAAQKDQAT